MKNSDWKNSIQESKLNYAKIGAVICPALNNELVYFNKHGFNHLIRKGRKLRIQQDRIKKLKLLQYAPIIISNTRNITEHIKSVQNDSCAYFWAIHEKINSIKIRVIIRQNNNGNKHFFSIMEE